MCGTVRNRSVIAAALAIVAADVQALANNIAAPNEAREQARRGAASSGDVFAERLFAAAERAENAVNARDGQTLDALRLVLEKGAPEEANVLAAALVEADEAHAAFEEAEKAAFESLTAIFGTAEVQTAV